MTTGTPSKSKTAYRIQRIPLSRLLTMDIGVLGFRKHHIKVLAEFDVTTALEKIGELKKSDAAGVSFTAWLLKCIAISLQEHPQIHALRMGKRVLVLFDDVDISIMVEKNIGTSTVPIPYVVRNVNTKTVQEIFSEIESVKKAELTEKMVGFDGETGIGVKFFLALPQCFRLIIWKIILSNPQRVKKMMGTCLVTSVGMFASLPGWAVPFSIHPVSFTIGSIVKKPCCDGEGFRTRDILHATILIDHDVVDGAPAARYVSYLKEMIENGKGL